MKKKREREMRLSKKKVSNIYVKFDLSVVDLNYFLTSTKLWKERTENKKEKRRDYFIESLFKVNGIERSYSCEKKTRKKVKVGERNQFFYLY